MISKTLVAATVAGLFIGSASAANVTLYGVVDEGLFYQHDSNTAFDNTKTTSNTFDLRSGINAGSRWGLKGSEQLGNGYAVSFKLESGFNADDGTLQQSRLFRRESSLTVNGPFGALSFGRLGGLGSSAGTYDIVFATGDAFDGLPKLASAYQISDRYDNVVTYQTPKFAGIQATAQYSFKTYNQDSDGTAIKGTEGKSDSNRYAAFAITGEFGNLDVVAAYERQIWANTNFSATPTANNNDDQNTFYLGGNYDFGTAKLFFLGQYFTGARKVGIASLDDTSYLATNTITSDGLDGYGLHLGTQFQALGGKTILGVYYVHAKTDDLRVAGTVGSGEVKNNFVGVAGRYVYPLSKRTSLYAGLEYTHQKVELSQSGAYAFTQTNDAKQNSVGGYFGLTHTF